MKNTAIFLSLLFLMIGCSSQLFGQSKPYVVMLSMDGFRWDYDDNAHTPVLDSIARAGAKVEALVPSFPSKTFPNHYTIATGLVPDHHGIVMNKFYDPRTAREYSVGNRQAVEDGTFYGGLPIWCAAERENVKAASYFWVGSEAEINGCRPTYWKKYDHQFPYVRRVDSVLHWLALPYDIRPHLVMWYIDEPDGIGHEHGPLSPQCISKVEELDRLLGVFFRKARELSQFDSINFIIVSDHGMGPISAERVVSISEQCDPSWVTRCIGGNPVYTIQAAPGKIDSLYQSLSKVKHIKVYRNNYLRLDTIFHSENTVTDTHIIYRTPDCPPELRFGTNPRFLDLTVVADSAWSLNWKPGRENYLGGTHGYDIRNSDMHAIFYGCGPAFRKGVSIPSMSNTDIYPLICHILGLKCPDCDGTLDASELLLQN
jgi:predicted AlkP superfamily pyrophosphatase or phosphodiesterase